MREYFPLAVLAAIISFAAFNRLYFRADVRIRLVFIASALTASIPAFLFAGSILLYLPNSNWFFDARAIEGIEASVGLVGALLGMAFASSKLRPNKLNIYVLIFCTLASVGLVLLPFVPRLFESPRYSAMNGQWKEGICLQSTRYTCVPACAATLIKMQGGNLSEAELAKSMETYSHGTEYWYMKRGLRRFGYEARRGCCKSLSDAPKPCMIGVVVSGLGHVVVLLETTKTGVVIGEPLRGRRKYSWKVFNKCYQPNGTYTTISRMR